MDILARITDAIVNPLIVLLFGVAMVYFLWGVFVFVRNADNEEKRSEGAMHIFWGIVGIFIMVSVYGILRMFLNTFGIPSPF